MKLILTLLFEQLHKIWQCRNTQTHGADSSIQDQILREHLTIRVEAIYNKLPNLLALDRQAFETLTKEDILSGSTSTIRSWLRMAEPTIQRCLKDAQQKSSTHQRDIRDYFEEASYVDSDESDTTLSFDTLDSGTIRFTPSPTPSLSTQSSNPSLLESPADSTA